MSTKANPGEFDCYSKLEPDEPYFLLMARDASAPDIVRLWAAFRKLLIFETIEPRSDGKKVIEAFECANAMEAWRKNRES